MVKPKTKTEHTGDLSILVFKFVGDFSSYLSIPHITSFKQKEKNEKRKKK